MDLNNNPYALKHIIDPNTGEEHYFNWDIKGNMTHHLDINQGNERHLCWTEDNRLQGIQDNNMGVFYGYDASGERGLKLTGPTIQVNINGYNYQVSALKEQTLYANPLITINDKGYTKHYFEEGKRICSKIGSGELRDINDLVGHIERNYEEQLTMLKDGIRDMHCLQSAWFDLENDNLYETIIKLYEGQIHPDEPIFYFHSDHLGSASFLTDNNGYETQQLVYLPFGEDWVDWKYNTSQYDTPYKFNGKEKDEETGYNNYGARYYYDWASIWLSVDPMSDKYPHLTPYNYCANNPVMLIDPDGREMKDPPWKSVNPVIDKNKFVKYDGSQCFDLAKKQLNVAGYTTKAGYYGRDQKTNKPTTYQVYTEQKGVNKNETKKAVEYVNESLDKGIPILAGVDNTTGDPGNHDKTTDHYIVIIGKGNDKQGNYYSFYDNATSNTNDGTSSNNKLYYDEQTGKITGKSNNGYARTREKDYTITHIRETKKIEGN